MATTPSDLRLEQLRQYSIIERVCSVLSLVGSVFIIATFCYSKTFHKPINRLVVFASFGNMMTNVSTLMARTYVSDPNGAGCQLQAFLIQMFLPADTLWTLAMAVNVYLTFYHKFDAAKLRKMELPYLIVCYGVPFVVAITYIFVKSPSRGRMYGDATLWCWISPRWDIWRIATFYGPIWVVILITFFIYIRAGGEIYRKHKQLRNFHSSTRSCHEPEPLPPMDDPLIASKTTEVSITSEAAPYTAAGGSIDLAPLGRRPSDHAPPPPVPPVMPGPVYSVHISSGGHDSRQHEPPRSPETETKHALAPAPVSASSTRPTTSRAVVQQPRARTSHEATNAAWSYTKCALLFFTAMLVTWIPSSANRVYSVVHVDQTSLTLEYMSAFVLPLQGFWNAVIYIVTSWKACKLLFHDIFLARRPVTELVDYRGSTGGYFKHQPNNNTNNNNNNNYHGQAGAPKADPSFSAASTPTMSDSMSTMPPRPSDKSYESESMTDLMPHHEHSQEPRPHQAV